MNSSTYRKEQKKIIDQIEKQAKSNSLDFSTVSPVEDYENDMRICLTSVHIPHMKLVSKVQDYLINPLRNISPEHFYYSTDSLHMTIKNIRVINNPPHFDEKVKENSRKVFSETIPLHKKFNVYFYRFLFFPMSLALVGTTDPELDNIILDLDGKLNEAGIPDDKKYTNSQYFFSNITLVRFKTPISEEFNNKVKELYNLFPFEPYTVDSITLLICNAAFKKREILGNWRLN